MTQRGQFWGYHLLLDCKAGKLEKLSGARDANENLLYPDAKQNIINFVNELVERIDMKAYGNPQVEHFADHKLEAAGYTLVQMIETSSITCHFSDYNGDFYLDVFSCKPFAKEDAIRVVEEFFDPEQIRDNYLTRQA